MLVEFSVLMLQKLQSRWICWWICCPFKEM